ncbi:MAG: VTT domain-containing protein [bacterium]|nr:VTT domain-containing protein [bacterium]
MPSFITSALHYIEPAFLIETLGLIGVYAIVFAESGLFFGFFLPGDSLLFSAGLFASQGYFGITALVFGTMIAAILGDSVGYAFGRNVGPRIFSREDSFFFHKKHVERASQFYARHGKKAIILARFVPIIRTFAPIVAGVGRMEYRTFLTYNIIGGVVWTASFTLLGYFLGKAIPGIGDYIHYIVIGIIILSLVPIAYEWMRAKRAAPQNP